MELPVHEREIAKWIIKHAGGTCVDIGAGTGIHTKVMASIDRVNTVYAFEPIPYNYMKIASLNLPKVKIMPFALGKEAGVIRLYDKNINEATDFQWINATACKTDKAIGHGFDQYIDVPVMPLNKIIDRADLIKIDVEGMEYDVLLGAKGVYENAWMIIELHNWGDYDMDEMLSLIQQTHEIVNHLPEKIVIWHVLAKPKE